MSDNFVWMYEQFEKTYLLNIFYVQNVRKSREMKVHSAAIHISHATYMRYIGVFCVYSHHDNTRSGPITSKFHEKLNVFSCTEEVRVEI